MTVKKFVMINGDAKYCIAFLLNLYVKEALNCYNENDKKFNEDCITQVAEYSENCTGYHVAASAIKTCDLIEVDVLIPEKYNDIQKTLIDKIKPHFVDVNGNAPDAQIINLVEYFIRFVKITLVLLTDTLWEKRQSISMKLFAGTLRQISTLLIFLLLTI